MPRQANDRALALLRERFHSSRNRVLDLSYLRGCDHTVVAIQIAAEIKAQRTMAKQILSLTTENSHG